VAGVFPNHRSGALTPNIHDHDVDDELYFPGVMLMTRKLIGLAVAIFFLAGASRSFAQGGISPLSDYQYKRDFPQYEAIKKEPDLQKRADAILGFIKERPVSRILPFAASDYIACIKPILDQKNWAKAISMLETLQAALPTVQAAQAAIPEGVTPGVAEFKKDQLEPTQKMILQSLLGAYYQSKNWPKAAETAEKIYAGNPDKSMLPAMVDIYSKFNADKFLEYGKKMLAEFPMEQSYSVALQMAQAYLQKQDIPAATDMLSKIMDVYGDKVPPNVPEAQWNATRAFAYGVIAAPIYQNKDYPKAMELYEKVLKFDPKKADAYYYIGMCKWQAKDQGGAIEAFARAVVLDDKAITPRAKQYLEELYKAEHSDSLDGLDAVLQKAKTDLGLQ
jgi:tetratricopeptide (TPR) repeat protein